MDDQKKDDYAVTGMIIGMFIGLFSAGIGMTFIGIGYTPIGRTVVITGLGIGTILGIYGIYRLGIRMR